jgi:AcrR family transcriptional regulator
MFTKRGPEYEAKRAALRQAAARMLADSPSENPSWPGVAAQVGMSPGAIAYYYGNSGNLLWSVVSEHLRLLLARLEAEAPEELEPRARIAALARAYCSVMEEHEAEHRTVLAHQRRLPASRSGDARLMQRWVLQAFEDAFVAALPRAEAGRAMPLALSLLSLLNGHAYWFRAGKGLDRTAFAEMAARMILSEVPPPRAKRRRLARVAGSSCDGVRAAA